MSKHIKLTKPEKVLISEWKKQGLCGNEIAKRLGRNRSTIGREFKRNSTKVKIDKVLELIYEPVHAQFMAMERKQKAFNAKQPLKNKYSPHYQKRPEDQLLWIMVRKPTYISS